MAATDPLQRVRAALGQLARADAGELLAEARAEARGRARSMLADALTDAMLEETATWLSDDQPTSAPTVTERPDPPRGDLTAVYVYGVLARDGAASIDDVPGLWGHKLEMVFEGDLAAVVSRVPGDQFGESALRTHLADMAWVESVARAHEQVLDHLCKRTTVIPMRMCTVYQAERGAREMLEREARGLSEALEQLEGKREWGVQAFFLRSRATPVAGGDREPADDQDEASSGAAYLQRRREERDLDEHLDELVEEAVKEIHEKLAYVAADSALNAPQSREASGNRGDMVLNGVYLLADQDLDAFTEQVDTLGSRFVAVGLELSITGPWPPYNFLPGSIGATW